MNFEDFVKPSVVMDLVQTIGLVALWLRKPGETASEQVSVLTGRVDVLEERIKHMPSSSELAELEGTVKAIQASLQGIQESQASVKAAVARIEQYLLSHGR